MEVVLGALPSLLPKLAELLVGEYNLQREVKEGIRFLRSELESMQGALEKISETPVDQLDKQDKIWAGEVRELSYDIEDKIDIFMVEVLGSEPSKQQGLKKFIDKTIRSVKQPKSRRKIAVDIRDIRCRVEEVAKRPDRYKVDSVVAKPIDVDPRLLAQFKKATELVGIEEARDVVIQILMGGKDESKKQCNIVSIVGFGGLGKTTLANAVYEKLRAQFDCSAFVSVSQTPDMKKLFKGMLCELGKNINEDAADVRRLIYLLRDFLQNKRTISLVIVLPVLPLISLQGLLSSLILNSTIQWTTFTFRTRGTTKNQQNKRRNDILVQHQPTQYPTSEELTQILDSPNSSYGS